MRALSILLFASLTLNTAIFSQEITGNLVCRVIDIDNEPVYRAILEVNSTSLQGTRSSLANEDGFIRISLLPPGYYTLSIKHISYQKVKIDSVRIRLGKTTDIGEIKIVSGPLEMQQVVVTDKRNLINQTSTVTGGNYTREEIESLPLQRDYKDILFLIPQINKSYLGDDINFAGATGSENKFYIDGVDVTDPALNWTGTNLPYNFVKEVEVKIGGYEAEHKSSLGGIVNVITQFGGDKFTGQVFGFYTNNSFEGEPKTENEVQPSSGDYSSYDFGFSLGGPIIKENFWFNVAYNPKIYSEDRLIPGVGYENDKIISHIFAGKLSWRASNNLQLLLNLNGDPTQRDIVQSNLGSGIQEFAYSAPALTNQNDGGYSIAIQGFLGIAKNLILEGTLSRLLWNFTIKPRTAQGEKPRYIDYNTGIVSGGVGSMYETVSIKYNPSLKLSWTLKNHIIKLGTEFVDNSLNDESKVDVIYKYSDSLYIQSKVSSSGIVGNRVLSFFVQDQWKINNRLQINTGLRWDGQYIINAYGGTSQKILNQFQPRIGLVYIPDGNYLDKIFAYYGRFYQELNTFAFRFYYLPNLIFSNFRFDHDPRIDPSGGDTLYVIPGQIQPEISGMDGQYFDEFSLGYERLLFDSYRFSIRGVYRFLGNGIEDSYSAEWEKFVFGNPGKYPLNEYPRMKREYTALEISLQKISSDPLNFLISYVLSRNYGNYGGLFESEYIARIPNATYLYDFPETLINGTGLLPSDRTHSFKFFGSYRFNFGLDIGLSFFLSNGTPLNELGASIYGPYELNFLKQRGSTGRTPTIWDVNLRLSYYLPESILSNYNTRLIADIFHVASNRTAVNYDQVKYLNIDQEGNQTDPNPTYGRAVDFLPPMLIRLGLEINF